MENNQPLAPVLSAKASKGHGRLGVSWFVNGQQEEASCSLVNFFEWNAACSAIIKQYLRGNEGRWPWIQASSLSNCNPIATRPHRLLLFPCELALAPIRPTDIWPSHH
ncbi:D-alanine--D-alanine ligase [Trichinella pseudospiralis]